MKILIVHDYAALLGGAEILTRDLCVQLRQRGHDVRVFASRAGASPDEYSRFSNATCYGTTSALRTPLQCFNPDAYLKLKKVIQEFKPDVIHVKMFLTQLSPAILPLLRGIPALYHAVWYRAVCPLGTKLLPDGRTCHVPAGKACLKNRCTPAQDWPLHMAQRKMLQSLRHVFDVVVANSETTRQKLLDDDFVSTEKIRVIWNGVPSSATCPILANEPLVVCSGRLVPEKGVDVLLRAFARVVRSTPRAQLLICGDGPERIRLQKLAKVLKIAAHVQWTGHVNRETVEALSKPAWVQAVPSVWDEPFGNVVAEAMMHGTAVLASDAGGPAELVKNRITGVLAPPGDVAAWANALQALLGDKARCQTLGDAGRDFASRFLTLEKCVDEFDSLYRAMCAAKVENNNI